MIVKNRTRLAKRRFIVGAFVGQILHHADQAPCQHQAEAQKQ